MEEIIERKPRPVNLLNKAPPPVQKRTNTFGDETRTAEVEIARRKRQVEIQMKSTAVDPSTIQEQESDSDLENDKKSSIKETGALIRRKISKLRTFKHSVNPSQTTPNATSNEDDIEGFIYSEAFSMFGDENDTMADDKSMKHITDKQNADKHTNKSVIFDQIQVKAEEPATTKTLQKPGARKFEQTKQSIKVEEPPAKRTRHEQNVHVMKVDEVIKQPLPLQNFFDAIQPFKDQNAQNKLSTNNKLGSYFVTHRLYANLYKTIGRNYSMISDKTQKRNKLGRLDGSVESLEEIGTNQRTPIMITREYEQSMMRTVKPGERTCLNGSECEFLLMFGKTRLPGTEFLFPEERLEFEKTGKLPDKLKPCILCMRREVTIHWMNARSECGSMANKWLFQVYYNLVEIDGEYLLEFCIMSAETEIQVLTHPVVIHVRSLYTQIECEQGVWMYLQTGYPKPEDVRDKRRDFCSGPSILSALPLDL